MLKIKHVVMLVCMLAGACGVSPSPQDQEQEQEEIVETDQSALLLPVTPPGADCSTILGRCYQSCQQRTQPASCYTACETQFNRCLSGGNL